MYLEALVYRLLLTKGGEPTTSWEFHLRGFLFLHSYAKKIASDRPKELEVHFFTLWKPLKRQRDG
ncbi:MAG: hypothetical protein D6767_01470 [Candidatus Hydrogenedentota bacterium]|nr:MAG: hypothetical protein D6767_01470 [Candidatus Hydrogenedentota bacterium]